PYFIEYLARNKRLTFDKLTLLTLLSPTTNGIPVPEEYPCQLIFMNASHFDLIHWQGRYHSHHTEWKPSVAFVNINGDLFPATGSPGPLPNIFEDSPDTSEDNPLLIAPPDIPAVASDLNYIINDSIEGIEPPGARRTGVDALPSIHDVPIDTVTTPFDSSYIHDTSSARRMVPSKVPDPPMQPLPESTQSQERRNQETELRESHGSYLFTSLDASSSPTTSIDPNEGLEPSGATVRFFPQKSSRSSDIDLVSGPQNPMITIESETPRVPYIEIPAITPSSDPEVLMDSPAGPGVAQHLGNNSPKNFAEKVKREEIFNSNTTKEVDKPSTVSAPTTTARIGYQHTATTKVDSSIGRTGALIPGRSAFQLDPPSSSSGFDVVYPREGPIAFAIPDLSSAPVRGNFSPYLRLDGINQDPSTSFLFANAGKTTDPAFQTSPSSLEDPDEFRVQTPINIDVCESPSSMSDSTENILPRQLFESTASAGSDRRMWTMPTATNSDYARKKVDKELSSLIFPKDSTQIESLTFL
ncbi:hypothetical protein HDU67_004070, partial [Dinochytrium kinnereticum]